MAEYDQSIVDLVKSAIRDAQDLVRGEIALAKTELRREMKQMTSAVVALAVAAVMGVIALVFLFATIAFGISAAARWPVWAGFAIVTLIVIIAAGILAYGGRQRLVAQRHMPKTMDTMKENAKWMKARTS